MYNAGLIGNLGIMQALGQQVTMKANQYLPKGASPYSIRDFMPATHDFFEPPKTKEEKKKELDFGLAMLGNVPPSAMVEAIKQAEAKRGN